MSKNLSNSEVLIYSLNITSIFGKKFKVITEFVKEKTFTTINIKLSDGFFSRMYEMDNNGFSLDGFTYYNGKSPFNHIIEKESFEVDIEEAIFTLTKEIQAHLLQIEVNYIVDILKKNGLNVNFTSKKDGSFLEFDIFNIDNPNRSITIYISDGNIKYEFNDPRISDEVIKLFLDSIDNISYELIVKWLSGVPIKI